MRINKSAHHVNKKMMIMLVHLVSYSMILVLVVISQLILYQYVQIVVRRVAISTIHVTNVRWLNIAMLHVKRNIDINTRKIVRSISGVLLNCMTRYSSNNLHQLKIVQFVSYEYQHLIQEVNTKHAVER